jgi:hypothetical protein
MDTLAFLGLAVLFFIPTRLFGSGLTALACLCVAVVELSGTPSSDGRQWGALAAIGFFIAGGLFAWKLWSRRNDAAPAPLPPPRPEPPRWPFD